MALDEGQAESVVKAVVESKDDINARLSKGELLEGSEDDLGNKSPSLAAAVPEDMLAFDGVTSPLGEETAAERVTFENDSEAKSPDQKTDWLVTDLKPRKRQSGGDAVVAVRRETAPRPVTLGPVEELERLDLEEFRRFGKIAKQAVSKLYQKIDLLGDESIELKASAIKAWHRSPLYKMYVQTGQQSMETGKSIEDILRQDVSGNTLSIDEFQAIADLNRKLNF